MFSFTTLFIFNLYKFFHIFHTSFSFFSPLLNIPNSNLAIMARGAAQYVAILSWAECLDAVCVGLQLFCHSVALKIHHHHQTFPWTVTLPCPTAPAITAHP